MIRVLAGKHIVLGVTGSIAAYKAAEVASRLTQAGALVDVLMTPAARQFVTPLTFQAVTGRPAVSSRLQRRRTAGGDGRYRRRLDILRDVAVRAVDDIDKVLAE